MSPSDYTGYFKVSKTDCGWWIGYIESDPGSDRDIDGKSVPLAMYFHNDGWHSSMMGGGKEDSKDNYFVSKEVALEAFFATYPVADIRDTSQSPHVVLKKVETWRDRPALF